MMRGYETHYVGDRWLFTDTGQAVESTWKTRPCGYCERANTPEGHDGCLGTLPGVMNACCGHGVVRDAYVQLGPDQCVKGSEAIRLIDTMRAGRITPIPQQRARPMDRPTPLDRELRTLTPDQIRELHDGERCPECGEMIDGTCVACTGGGRRARTRS